MYDISELSSLINSKFSVFQHFKEKKKNERNSGVAKVDKKQPLYTILVPMVPKLMLGGCG